MFGAFRPPPHKRRALHGGGPLHNGHASNGDSHKTQAPKCCELIAGNEERETVTPTRRNEQGENNRVTRRLMEFILPVASSCVSLASDLMPIHCHTPRAPCSMLALAKFIPFGRGSWRALKTTLLRGRGGRIVPTLILPADVKSNFNWQNKFHPQSQNRWSMVAHWTML